MSIRYGWWGLGLGLLFGGPIGAFVGWLIGRRLEKRQERRRLLAENRGLKQEVVAAAVVVLAAKLAKADGQVSEAEVRAFKETFLIPPEEEFRVARLWEAAKNNSGGFEPQAWQLAQVYRKQPVMLERIFSTLQKIARADDGRIHPKEQAFLDEVARIFHLRDLAAVADWGAVSGFKVERRSDMGEVEDALRDIFRPEGAGGGGLDKIMGKLETANAGWTVSLGRWKGRILANPLSRPFYSLFVAALFGLGSHYLMPSGLRGLFPHGDVVLASLVGILAGGVAFLGFPRPERTEDQVADAARKAKLDPRDVAGVIDDARARVAAIRSAARNLESSIKARIEAICDIASSIIDGFREDPSDIRRSRRFLGHYLVATQDLVIRYASLADKGVETRRLEKVIAKFEPVLAEIEDAFRQQYRRNLDDDALELDVQIDVLRQTLRSEAS